MAVVGIKGLSDILHAVRKTNFYLASGSLAVAVFGYPLSLYLEQLIGDGIDQLNLSPQTNKTQLFENFIDDYLLESQYWGQGPTISPQVFYFTETWSRLRNSI